MRRERTSPLPVEIERLALLGWRLTPATATKRGLFPGYLDVATHDLDVLEQWTRTYPSCCWKVVPDGSSILLLDVDVRGATHAEDGVATLRALCEAHGPLPPRPHGRTPSGGHLLVFRDPGTPVRRGSGVLGPGIDILHHRLAAMVAPSVRRGGTYRWSTAPWELAAPPVPAWLLKLLEPPPLPPKPQRPLIPTADHAVRALMRSLSVVAEAAPGTRNVSLLRRATLLGGFVAASAIGEDEVERELVAAGMAAGLPRHEAIATVRSGIRRGLARPIEWEAPR